MTYKCADYFGNLDNEYLTYKLQDFSKKYGMKHTPSVVAVKAIASRLAMKQRKRTGFDLEITNESKAQIHAKTGWSEGTISDVIKFLEWMGLVKTIRRGGGKNRLPTVRHMITTGRPMMFESKQDGIIFVLNGRRKKHSGIEDDQNGELPDTPRDIPVVDPQCVYVHESFTRRNKQNRKINEYTHIEDKSDLELLICDEETEKAYRDLLCEINDPLNMQALKDGLDESDKSFALFVESLGDDVLVDLDEYSFTPDDVRDLMTGVE